MVTYRKDETQRPEGWNPGAPPHVGFWRTRDYQRDCDEWRYWGGESWSIFLISQERHVGGQIAENPCVYHPYAMVVEWKFDWPENARVARVNPETGEVTGSGPCPYETSGKLWPFGDVNKKAEDAPKLKKKPAGHRKVTQYVLMNNACPIYVADTLQELHDRIKAMPRISWTHYEKLRNRKKA